MSQQANGYTSPSQKSNAVSVPANPGAMPGASLPVHQSFHAPSTTYINVFSQPGSYNIDLNYGGEGRHGSHGRRGSHSHSVQGSGAYGQPQTPLQGNGNGAYGRHASPNPHFSYSQP